MNRKGITLPEMLMVLSFISFLLGVSASLLQSLDANLKADQELHLLLSEINYFRYQALEENLSYRLSFNTNTLKIEKKINGNFILLKKIQFSNRTRISSNANPVFSALGFICPACTITYSRNKRYYILTLSSTGRIQYKKAG